MSLKQIRTRLSELEADLEWYKKYGEYINRVHPIIDAEASGYADDDEEYAEAFNQNANNL